MAAIAQPHDIKIVLFGVAVMVMRFNVSNGLALLTAIRAHKSSGSHSMTDRYIGSRQFANAIDVFRAPIAKARASVLTCFFGMISFPATGYFNLFGASNGRVLVGHYTY